MGILLMVSSVAHAVITEHVIVMIGVKLTPAQAKTAYAKQAELEKAGLRLVTDPSLTYGNTPVAATTYIGRVLATQQLDRNKPTAANSALPTVDQIDTVKKLLAAKGLPVDAQLIVVVEHSGGK
jgi:hypothetical protein